MGFMIPRDQDCPICANQTEENMLFFVKRLIKQKKNNEHPLLTVVNYFWKTD